MYLLDFGLAKKYRSSKTLEQFSFKTNKKLTGTARYASINALSGGSQARRDDLESVGYVLVYLLKGKLPWQGLKVYGKEDKYQKILHKKRDTDVNELCSGLPKELSNYIVYAKKLDYCENPDYDYMAGLLQKVLDDNHWINDSCFEWLNLSSKNSNTNVNNVDLTKKTENNSVKAINDKENDEKEG